MVAVKIQILSQQHFKRMVYNLFGFCHLLIFVLSRSFQICDFLLDFLKSSKWRGKAFVCMETENRIGAALWKAWSCLAMLAEVRGGSSNKTQCREIARGYSVQMTHDTHQVVFK